MKTKNNLPLIVFFLAGFFTIIACEKDDDEELRKQERRLREQYLIDNNINVEPTASGLYYIEKEKGDGPKPLDLDYVEVEFTAELLNGTVVATTYDTLAREEGIFDEYSVYGPMRVRLGSILPGLDEGIKLMNEGGLARLIIPSELAYGGSSTGLVPKYSTLLYEVKLITVIKDPDAYETALLQDYLDAQGLDAVASTDSIYYIESVAGEGELIDDQDIVACYYTGKYLDGRVFDTNVGESEMVITVPDQFLIDGFNEGIKRMKKGSIGTIVIPHKQGYGADGMVDQFGRTKVGPYQTILFELEITDVR